MLPLLDHLMLPPALFPGAGLGICSQTPRRGCRSASICARTHVKTSDAGWLVTVKLPGLSPDAITVETTSQDSSSQDHPCTKLAIHALPHFQDSLQLPADADAAHITASLVDGVLTVAVPRRAPERFDVPVKERPSDAAADPLSDDAEDGGKDSLYTVPVPGFSAGRLAVHIERRSASDTVLIVQGRRSTADEALASLAALALAPDVDVANVAVTCAHGLLHLHLPRPASAAAAADAEPLTLPIADGAAAEGESEAGASEATTVLRAPLPGFPVSAVALTVHGRTLKVEAEHRGALQCLCVALPKGVPASALSARLTDGLLTVTAPPAPKPTVTAVPLRTDVPAAIAAPQ